MFTYLTPKHTKGIATKNRQKKKQKQNSMKKNLVWTTYSMYPTPAKILKQIRPGH